MQRVQVRAWTGLAVAALVVSTMAATTGIATAASPRHDLSGGPSISTASGVVRYQDQALAKSPTRRVSGSLSVAPGEPGGPPTRYGVTVNGITLPVALAGSPHLSAGSRFVGTLVAAPEASARALRERTSRVVSATITPVAAPTTRRILLAAPTNLGTSPSDATVLATAQKTVEYWKEQSTGAITSFTRSNTVLRYATKYVHPRDCGLGADVWKVRDEVRAKFSGLGAGDTVAVFVPETCGVGNVGISTGGETVNADGVWLDTVVAHEEGHEVGLDHANLWECDPDVATSCYEDEYGDITSTMGLAYSYNGAGINQHTALNSLFRSVLGWDQPGELQGVTLGAGQSTTTRDVTLQPRAATSGLRGLRIPDPDSTNTWFVEFRHAIGRDVDSAYDRGMEYLDLFQRGVSVLRRTAARPTASQLMPMGSLTDDWGNTYPTSALGQGASWTSPGGGLKVQVLSDNGAAGATVRITVTASFTPTVPTISAPKVGTPVSVTTGDWGSGTTFGYQWYTGSSAIKNATKSRYTPTASRVGKALWVRVTGTKPGHPKATRSSVSAKVAKGTLRTGTPTISGTLRVARKLTAHHGTWTPGTSYHYRWFAGGTAIRKATRSTYTLKSAQAGKVITVRVTGTKAGYTSAAALSAATAVVTR